MKMKIKVCTYFTSYFGASGWVFKCLSITDMSLTVRLGSFAHVSFWNLKVLQCQMKD